MDRSLKAAGALLLLAMALWLVALVSGRFLGPVMAGVSVLLALLLLVVARAGGALTRRRDMAIALVSYAAALVALLSQTDPSIPMQAILWNVLAWASMVVVLGQERGPEADKRLLILCGAFVFACSALFASERTAPHAAVAGFGASHLYSLSLLAAAMVVIWRAPRVRGAPLIAGIFLLGAVHGSFERPLMDAELDAIERAAFVADGIVIGAVALFGALVAISGRTAAVVAAAPGLLWILTLPMVDQPGDAMVAALRGATDARPLVLADGSPRSGASSIGVSSFMTPDARYDLKLPTNVERTRLTLVAEGVSYGALRAAVVEETCPHIFVAWFDSPMAALSESARLHFPTIAARARSLRGRMLHFGETCSDDDETYEVEAEYAPPLRLLLQRQPGLQLVVHGAIPEQLPRTFVTNTLRPRLPRPAWAPVALLLGLLAGVSWRKRRAQRPSAF